jgi:hypothetical protein
VRQRDAVRHGCDLFVELHDRRLDLLVLHHDVLAVMTNVCSIAVTLGAFVVGCTPAHDTWCGPSPSCDAGVDASWDGGAMWECANDVIPITISTPTTTATMIEVDGMIPMGAGAFRGRCVGATVLGHEDIYSLTIPAGAYDLALTTNIPTTGLSDTVLYVRRGCLDPTSELACDDDLDAGPPATDGGLRPTNFRSAFVVPNAPPGIYFVFVNGFWTDRAAFSYGLRVTLVPVLPTGASCDPTFAANRCANGNCAGTPPICP